jgi:hypothetical protein
VGLAQHSVCIARAPRWGLGPAIPIAQLPCAAVSGAAGATGSAEPWRAALDALRDWLGQQADKRLQLRVVLSGRFVRWQLLPWRSELSGRSETQAYAGVRFRETFGKLADAWNILPVAMPPGKTAPACAVDQALITALQAVCEAHGARLQLLTPYFSSAFDNWRGQLPGNAAWFGTVEADSCTLGLLQGGNWTALQTQRVFGDWRDVVPAMVAQIGLASGLDVGNAPLYLAGTLAPQVATPDFAFSWLRPKHTAQADQPDLRLAQGV